MSSTIFVSFLQQWSGVVESHHAYRLEPACPNDPPHYYSNIVIYQFGANMNFLFLPMSYILNRHKTRFL